MDAKEAFLAAARKHVLTPIDLSEYGVEAEYYLRPLTGREVAESRPRWQEISGDNNEITDESAAIEEMGRVMAMSLCDADGVNLFIVGDEEIGLLPFDLVQHVFNEAMALNGLTKTPEENAENLNETPGD